MMNIHTTTQTIDFAATITRNWNNVFLIAVAAIFITIFAYAIRTKDKSATTYGVTLAVIISPYIFKYGHTDTLHLDELTTTGTVTACTATTVTIEDTATCTTSTGALVNVTFTADIDSSTATATITPTTH